MHRPQCGGVIPVVAEMESLLNSRPSLQELMKKVCLKAEWYEIGMRLGLDSDELDAINSSPDSPGVKTSRMYKLWLESNPQATRRELIEVLEDMELNRQAAEYKKYLQQIIKKTTLRPEPILPEPNPTESIILSHPRIIVAIIILAILAFIIIIFCVRLPPPDSHTPPSESPTPPPESPTPPPESPTPPPESRTPPPESRTPPPESPTPPLNSHTPPPESRAPPPESRTPPPESRAPIPGVIERYGSELREKYIDTLTKYKDAEYNKYPTASPRVPFIPLISIVVEDNTKRTAEWLHITTPKEIIQNEEIVKIQIEDILKPVSEEQLKFVLIEGEPGIGKSTLAKELVLRWANRSDALLNNYDIVFLIQLRFETYHKVNASIKNLFIDLDDQAINMTDLNIEIKKRKGAGILWILDGFDELPSHLKNNSILIQLIKGDVLLKSTVIVTSRPVASDQLLNFLHDHNSKRISLRGFDPTKIEEYSLKYFNDKDKASKFRSYYSGNLMIESMLYNPLNCFIVCTIFNDLIATSNEQYPKTMTLLYNHYVRMLLKRHLIDIGLISDLDYDMPQNLMLETDFNDPPLQSVWKHFSLLSEIAYNGTMKQQYIFGKELHNVTKLSMMDTIFSFFVFEKDESSSFLHTTLQEYFAAVYLVNNKPKLTVKNEELQANLEVVFIFYVGICKIKDRELDSTVMDILKLNIPQHPHTEHVIIGSILLRCLYEDDSLLYNIGLPVNHSLHLHSSRFSTKFEYYIYGYLVAVHSITYTFVIGIYSFDEVKAFNKGLQSQSLVFKGKINLRVSSYSPDINRRVFNELLFMPSDPVIKMEIISFNKFNLQVCQIISRFKLLEEITVSAAILSACWSLKENPLLKLNTLNTNIGYLLHENELETLKQLIAPGRPIKILDATVRTNASLAASYYTVMKILKLLKMETSLEKLTIREDITLKPNERTNSYITWTRSTNSLTVFNYETLYYHIQIKNEMSTIQLSSFTSLYTHIKTNSYMLGRWIPAKVTVFSESTTFSLNHVIDAFGECLISLKKLLAKRINETINIKLNINFTCTCTIVEQDVNFSLYCNTSSNDTTC